MWMDLSRVAALALVGWYLMVPPVHRPKREPAYVDEHAAYQDWRILQDFKTADECDAGRTRAQSVAENGNLAAGVVDVDPSLWLTRIAEAECIAFDDPRLKAK